MVLDILVGATGIIALFGLWIYLVEFFWYQDSIGTLWVAFLLMIPFFVCMVLKF